MKTAPLDLKMTNHAKWRVKQRFPDNFSLPNRVIHLIKVKSGTWILRVRPGYLIGSLHAGEIEKFIVHTVLTTQQFRRAQEISLFSPVRSQVFLLEDKHVNANTD